jgi:hypothetical protein
MTKRLLSCAAALVVALAFGLAPAHADDLLRKNCPQLVRIAENYQTDLKTVETVLSSAIDAGNLDRIKNYKLRRAVIKQQLDEALRALDAKGCAKTR